MNRNLHYGSVLSNKQVLGNKIKSYTITHFIYDKNLKEQKNGKVNLYQFGYNGNLLFCEDENSTVLLQYDMNGYVTDFSRRWRWSKDNIRHITYRYLDHYLYETYEKDDYEYPQPIYKFFFIDSCSIRICEYNCNSIGGGGYKLKKNDSGLTFISYTKIPEKKDDYAESYNYTETDRDSIFWVLNIKTIYNSDSSKKYITCSNYFGIGSFFCPMPLVEYYFDKNHQLVSSCFIGIAPHLQAIIKYSINRPIEVIDYANNKFFKIFYKGESTIPSYIIYNNNNGWPDHKDVYEYEYY